MSVPLVYILLLVPGELPYVAHEWSFHSHLLEIIILVAPLLLMEFSVSRAIRWRSRLGEPSGVILPASPSQTPLVLLILVPFMPNLTLAIALLLIGFSISQMDVPTRQSYVMAVVAPASTAMLVSVERSSRFIARTAGPANSRTLPMPAPDLKKSIANR